MDYGFDGALQLPPGFRFHPTDEELVMYYLCRKCGGLPIAAPVIAEVDLYKFEPWRLPEKAAGGGQDSKEWYFFSPRDRKYPNGSRPNRAAGTGYWKATGADKPVGSPRPVAIKKALVFYAGKPPKGVKTNWIMHEYRLADVDRSAAARKKSSNVLRNPVLRLARPSSPSPRRLHKGINKMARNLQIRDQNELVNRSIPSSSSNNGHLPWTVSGSRIWPRSSTSEEERTCRTQTNSKQASSSLPHSNQRRRRRGEGEGRPNFTAPGRRLQESYSREEGERHPTERSFLKY